MDTKIIVLIVIVVAVALAGVWYFYYRRSHEKYARGPIEKPPIVYPGQNTFEDRSTADESAPTVGTEPRDVLLNTWWRSPTYTSDEPTASAELYNELNSAYKDQATFQVTPEKNCCLFPDSTPECRRLKAEGKLGRYCCPSGLYHGRPVVFEYTPESDRHWNDPRCKEPIGTMVPPIL